MSIARVWYGWASPTSADAYEEHFGRLVLPILNSVSGFRGAQLWRKGGEHDVEFVAVSYFDSVEAVKSFAGEDFEQAVVAPEARTLLLRFAKRCNHYLVVKSTSMSSQSEINAPD